MQPKIKPILFSTPMVQAILEGRKTMTRRVIKSRHKSGLFRVCRRKVDGEITSIESLDWDENNVEKNISCPYGNVGDVLWVRETFAIGHHPAFGNKFFYKTDKIKLNPFDKIKWKPSIFMPKEAARIFLEVTDVRVERLQDISEKDAIQEGVECCYPNERIMNTHSSFKGKDSFQSLWEKINGADSWYSNPFVWVIEFERIERPQ